MTLEQRNELLGLIAATQNHDKDGHGTAPVTVQIGYVDAANMVRDDGIVIVDAPPAVIYAVIDWVRAHKGPGLVCAYMVDFDGPHSRTRGLLVH